MNRFAAAIAIVLCTALKADAATPYLTGGSTTMPAAQQAILNEYQYLVALGINVDWLEASGLAVEPYIQAVGVAARAVEDGRVPGATFLVDRIGGETLPVLVGYQQTDPQRRRITRETNYYVHDLTFFLLTAPLAHYAVAKGDLTYKTKIGDLIPELDGSDKASITIEMLLRNATGLPAEIPQKEYASREEFLASITEWPLTSTPGTEVKKSPLNAMVLGLAIEAASGKPFSEYADAVLSSMYEQRMTSLGAIAGQRQFVAPGAYASLLGRMAWAESAEPIGQLLEPNAGHTGLVASILEVAEACNFALVMAEAESKLPAMFPGPLTMLTRGTSLVEGGKTMGLGMELDRFGPGSFGWDSPFGSSVWILPKQRGYIIYFSNSDHPGGIQAGWDDPRAEILPLLYRSLSEGRIDTATTETDAPPTFSPSPEATP